MNDVGAPTVVLTAPPGGTGDAVPPETAPNATHAARAADEPREDAAENADGTPAIYVDAKRNLVRDLRSSGSAGDRPRVIALVGVEDLVVVQTDDALLVMRRDRAQDVRAVVDELKRSGSRAL